MSEIALEFFGAAGEVTGSCTLVHANGRRILVDFGLFQGSEDAEIRNLVPPRVDLSTLTAVVVTHAHIDHCGRLGLLPKYGFTGKIYASTGTADLLPRVLRSSARLQRMRFYERADGTAPWARALMPGEEPGPAPKLPVIERMYEMAESRDCASRIVPVPLGKEMVIADDVSVRFWNAGHVVGAASVEILVGSGSDRKSVVFSGDLGSYGSPLLAPPESPRHADLVVIESTNGGRRRESGMNPERDIAAVLAEASGDRAKIIVPCFALGRAQQIVHRLSVLRARGELRNFNVYLDSPMAVHGMEALYKHPEYLAPALRSAVEAGEAPLWFPELHYLLSKRESMALDGLVHGGIVIAGSGFMDAGPILRHLEMSVDREDVRVLIGGYQPEGGMSWKLSNGADRLQFNGRIVPVRAKIARVEGLSGHADQDDLMRWLEGFSDPPGRVIINHGTDEGRSALATRVRTEIGCPVSMPNIGDTVSI